LDFIGNDVVYHVARPELSGPEKQVIAGTNMNCIVTGETGVGKTTTCRSFIKMASARGIHCGGVLSLKTKTGAITAQNIKTGSETILAGLDDNGEGIQVGRYFFYEDGLEFGRQAIMDAIDCDVLIVDELGALELGGNGFASAIAVINHHRKLNAVVVIRRRYLARFLLLFVSPPAVYDVTAYNRETVPGIILAGQKKFLSGL